MERNKIKKPRKCEALYGDPKGFRTPISAVKGLCPNH